MSKLSGLGHDGVVVVDKPAGVTSHDVVDELRRALGGGGRRRRGRGPKVGHAGTLDPEATGVLVVCIGRATRLVPFLQASSKTYDARMRLGVRTSTLDAAGEVLEERDASAIDEERLCQALKAHVGEIEQVPPMVSALKVGGERLYEKARRGEEVERAPRPVTIHDLVLEDFSPGSQAEAAFLVTCSPGTYIRTLAEDIGAWLGVGGHLRSLRRLGSGRFTAEDAVALPRGVELAGAGRLDEVLVGMAEAVADHPTRIAEADEARAISVGKALTPTGAPGPVALVDAAGALLAMIEDREGRARPLAVFASSGEGMRTGPQA